MRSEDEDALDSGAVTGSAAKLAFGSGLIGASAAPRREYESLGELSGGVAGRESLGVIPSGSVMLGETSMGIDSSSLRLEDELDRDDVRTLALEGSLCGREAS